MSNKVAEQSSAVKAMSADIELAATLMGGTRAIRAGGERYLPKMPAESQESYKRRLSKAVLYPAYSHTVETLTGKPFSKPITYDKSVPERLKAWCKNDVDLQGRNLDTFAADVFQEALALGLSGILVDFPKVDAGVVRTQADEQAAGVRPYMVQIHPTQILGWRATQKDGIWTFHMLRFMEHITEDDGEFGEKVIEQVRVLTPGAWATFRKDDKENWVPYENGITTVKKIPFVPVYGKRIGFMLSKPPMIELAYMNVEHYQSSSDQQTILHVARVPILTATGAGEDFTLEIGTANAVNLKAGAALAYVEHSGAAIGAGKESITALEERMRQAGAELLVLPGGNMTATQVGTENAVNMCALQRIVQSTEDALDLALQFMAEWVGEAEGGNVTIFNDFAANSLAEASMQVLVSMAGAGRLSDQTLFKEAQRRGIIAPDTDWDEEKTLIEEQGPPPGTLNDSPPPAPPVPPSK